MKKNIFEEEKTLNDSNNSIFNLQNQFDDFLRKINYKIFIFIIIIFINDIIFISKFSLPKSQYIDKRKNINFSESVYNTSIITNLSLRLQHQFMKEKYRPYLKEINKKRTFEIRLPLTKDINCKPHFSERELIAFLSFLTKNTTFFETGSGCSSLIAKYYTKKSYAVEGCKEWYEKGIKNGLKENLIFHDLKPDNPIWSYPGNNSDINDWKKYFQSYDESYNADIILLDGRFKVATALDIFEKIKEGTIVLIHEYQNRQSYFILENYYNYVYHWGTLVAFMKKKNIKSIPLQIKKKYWYEFI